MNWDDEGDRGRIAFGVVAISEYLELEALGAGKRPVVFDELHKYRRWKTFLKGPYDQHPAHLNIVVTGGARLDVDRRGGDSLMGRYFLYHMHPLSEGELLRPWEVVPQLPAEPRRLAPAKRADCGTPVASRSHSPGPIGDFRRAGKACARSSWFAKTCAT
ncbi:MAG: AAA family ATPase [Myxococcales bacterium]|nr:AAA family ATPase [Myxococcales bacterium]